VKPLPSPVTWIGGKAALLPHILPLLEPRARETLYVEPCGGSGVVLLNKRPHPSEVYNDVDGELVNLFRVLRDPDGVIHLWWELVGTPVARQEFGDALEATRREYSPQPPVKRAAQFVVRCRQRFGGGQPGGAAAESDRNWGTARGSVGGVNELIHRWLGTMMQLPAIHRRLATVVVDQQDAARCVEQWDSPATLFYVDPPYIGAEGYYQGGFADEDHARLAAALNAAAARVVLSYYDHPRVDDLYPADRWCRKRVSTVTQACGNRRANARSGSRARTELVLTNRDPAAGEDSLFEEAA